ncbi:MAG: hypothetical protein PHS96_03450 [Anaerolineales bacterium]|nr:hypothetical protein [Anaerolineales bacterium]
MTQVDVLVAGPGREIVLLIELEERNSTPKKIIGDVFTNLMCSQFAVRREGRQQIFTVSPQTRMIISGIIEARGDKLAQLQEVILPRLRQFRTPAGALDLNNLELLFEADIESLIGALKHRMRELYK